MNPGVCMLLRVLPRPSKLLSLIILRLEHERVVARLLNTRVITFALTSTSHSNHSVSPSDVVRPLRLQKHTNTSPVFTDYKCRPQLPFCQILTRQNIFLFFCF